MPTYEYRCNACGREFEYQQRMSDPDLVKCEACGEDKLEKLISATAFQLKGGGWYKDLYSSTKPADAAKAPADKGGAAKTEAPAASSSSESGGSSSASGGDAGGASSGTSGSTSGSSGSSSGGSSQSTRAASSAS